MRDEVFELSEVLKVEARRALALGDRRYRMSLHSGCSGGDQVRCVWQLLNGFLMTC